MSNLEKIYKCGIINEYVFKENLHLKVKKAKKFLTNK